ncbi:uncharacterized protein JCM15063_002475 [Sporobolomyces koalae]|uniref:uncharacterized protein n=1 Tax=Sporobolomyces koalae TaxID=500713 RepID=UPI00316E3E87
MIDHDQLLHQLINPYRDRPDFGQLAVDVPALAPFLIPSAGGSTIDWKDDSAVRALTNACLERDFQLKLELPHNRLCPTIPSRLEYCLWVLKLSLLTRSHPSDQPLVGLDIGTGASCIYPCLIAKTLARLDLSTTGSGQSRFRSKMFASEIDPESLDHARSNVARNHLDLDSANKTGQVIVVVEAETNLDQPRLIPRSILNQHEPIDFVMCNPPFYTHQSEIDQAASQKLSQPFAVCTASKNELITKGGEVEFVGRIIQESLELGTVGTSRISNTVRWFTSLIGKHSSIEPLVSKLRASKITNYQVQLMTRLGQTRRWILTWSLLPTRIPHSILATSTDFDPTLSKFESKSIGIHSFEIPFTDTLTNSTTNDRFNDLIERVFGVETFGENVRFTISSIPDRTGEASSREREESISMKRVQLETIGVPSWTRSFRRSQQQQRQQHQSPILSKEEDPRRAMFDRSKSISSAGGTEAGIDKRERKRSRSRSQVPFDDDAVPGGPLVQVAKRVRTHQDVVGETEETIVDAVSSVTGKGGRNEGGELVLAAEFTISLILAAEVEQKVVRVQGEWRYGVDEKVWESLWGVVRTRFKTLVGSSSNHGFFA